MADVVVLAETAFDPAELLAELSARSAGAGAIASFTGVARPTAKTGDPVARIQLDHHPRLTLESMQDIAQAARRGFDIQALTIVHRCGAIAAGEPIVFVGASATNRRAAFEAVDYAMDRLKTEALLWKREFGSGASCWIEPTEADHRARARWEATCPE